MKKHLLLAGILGLSFSSLSFSADSFVVPVNATVLDQCKFLGTPGNLVFGTLSAAQNQNITAIGSFRYACTLGTQARIEVGSDNSPTVASLDSTNFAGDFFMDGRQSGLAESLLKYQLDVNMDSLVGNGYTFSESIPVTLTGTISPEDYRVARVSPSASSTRFQNNLYFVLTP
jgi:spore coat protein U-like protein